MVRIIFILMMLPCLVQAQNKNKFFGFGTGAAAPPPAAQNLLLYSEDFSQSAWSKNSSPTLTVDGTLAPDGTATATKLSKAATGTFKSISQQFLSVVDNTYTFSVYVKLVSGAPSNYASIALVGTGSDVRYKYDLSTGTITQHTSSGSSYVSSGITDVGSGWKRITLTAIAKGTNLKGFIYVGDLAASDINEAIYAWGAQMVDGTVPRDYTKTTSTNVP